MGTSYSIQLADRLRLAELREIKAAVDERLLGVNVAMSTWIPNSEISKFNQFHRVEPFPVLPEFFSVVQRALDIAEATDGAFDPTVKPLVDHWGFGSKDEKEPLDEILQAVGWRKVRTEDGTLIKANPMLQLDLSAIAKGYGVDAVAGVLRRNGIRGFIVEIGGEIVADGLKSNGQPWRVGIETPDPDQPFGSAIQETVMLSGKALATSGDYRNFRFREDGTRYSHIIDPQTGRPAETDMASVSVLADSCMNADAIATALFVMGSEKSFQWLSSHPELEVFCTRHSTNGTFASRSTVGFPIED